MKLSAVFAAVVEKAADYHMNHRGHLGLAFGLAVGVGLSYMGFWQDAMFSVAGDLIEEGADRGLMVNSLLEISAGVITLSSLVADVAIHSHRDKKSGPKPPDPK